MTAAYDKDEARADVYKEAYLYDLDNDPYEMVNLVGLTSFRFREAARNHVRGFRFSGS
ncbi:hypothetical protein JNB88_17795 [Rhizobium cauense]|uniref:hypothetical protein n=1 Tax=Rhizobium cauense TaxID=1166683 RepID=UPI001C6DFF85|nr:hypothetical protein [Rhizobium cauense]MBW9115497.1 hypothetical protein [Rhizobium cauense]